MLLRSLFRTIRSTLGRFLAIFAIIALGVGFFIGLRVTHDSMLKTADDYLTDLLLYDFRLVSTLGLTDEDVNTFARDSAVALSEGSFSIDALIETAKGQDDVLHFHTLLPDVNRVDLVSGRLPETSDEIVLDARYAGPGMVGKTVTLAESNDEDTLEHFGHSSFKVVGTANTSYYVNFERGSTSLGSGKVSGFAYALPAAFDADYYTEVFLRLKDMPSMGSQAYDKAADAQQDRLEGLLEERGQIRYEDLKQEANDKIEEAQAEIDEIVVKRVARVKKQYGDYEDMKKKAAKLDEIEAANKSELEKLTEQNQKLAAQLAEREHAALIQAACIKHGVPADYMDLITGADEESIDKAAEKVAKLASASVKPPKGPSGTEGQHPQGHGTPSIDEQIRTAEAKGDYATSMMLKSLKLNQQ